MFANSQAFSSFSVDDTDKAKEFYGDVLGIKLEEDNDMGFFNMLLDDKSIMVYPKPNHSPATYTVLNFIVDDIEKSVDQMESYGISFEQYNSKDMPQDSKGIMRMGDEFAQAWFCDPAGNVLSILQQ